MIQGRSPSCSQGSSEKSERGAPRRRRTPESAAAVVAVGLTGGIGAGKSTALSMFRDLGALTVSADQVVHALYARPEFRDRVVARFGQSGLDSEGAVDRGRLADSVRGDARALRWLEKLTHPAVAEEIERCIKEAPPGTVIVCEVPLLFETGSQGLFDLVVTVEAALENRRRRCIHRFDPAVFVRFEELQACTDERVAGSDLVYFNDGDVERLSEFVRGTYARAQELLEELS